MTYTFSTSFGGDTILAPCLQVLCAEIAAHPDYKQLTNLGEIGDRTHQTQGYSSDHNPWLRHDGKGYVRAIDLGGDHDRLMRLRGELFKIYRRHDPRLYPYGYLKGPDSNITDWPPGTGWHRNTGDEGHLHISVTQKNGNNPSPSGWVPALDSRAPWGISRPIPAPNPNTPSLEAPDMMLIREPVKGGIYLVHGSAVTAIITMADYNALAKKLGPYVQISTKQWGQFQKSLVLS